MHGSGRLTFAHTCVQRLSPPHPAIEAPAHPTHMFTRGATTDAEVFVVLSGSKGKSGFMRLENGPDNFERGRTDKFVLQLPVGGVGGGGAAALTGQLYRTR